MATRPGGMRIAAPGGEPGGPGRAPAGGDVILSFGGVEVRTLEDLTFALRGHRAGDRVQWSCDARASEQSPEAMLEERR